ncbi:MAG: LD-carboxypeptidase [Bacteroidetes bacterium]|nr:LD-carboxypeptidase [Bacteroidota bacterium]
MIITPPCLKEGDTIGIVCPAGYMAAEKAQTCIHTLQEWGYRVQTGTTLGGHSTTYFSGTDEERLRDLQRMLDDSSINAILFGRGGYGTGRIIDHINWKKFRKHPKWIIGYSDITVIHSHLHRNFGISSLHAPMAGAFNDEGYKNEYILSLKNALEGKKAVYNADGHAKNREGEATGELVGGNLSLLAHLMGSESEIKTKNRILFLEDVGEQLYNIDRMLHQLKRSGKLAKLAGLIFGGFTEVKDTERPFGKAIHDILSEIVQEYDYPVCYDFPVSHTDKNYALKIGVEYTLRVKTNGVQVEERT